MNPQRIESIANPVPPGFLFRKPDEPILFPSFEPPIPSLTLAEVRFAVRAGRISFPSQVPVFYRDVYRPDIQWRVVLLYFCLGWQPARIAERYRLGPKRIRQMVRSWLIQAVSAGCVQYIPQA